MNKNIQKLDCCAGRTTVYWLKITELYALNEWTAWFINYTSVTLFLKIYETKNGYIGYVR